MTNEKGDQALSFKVMNDLADAGREGLPITPSNAEHRQYLLEYFGGEAFAKYNFPLLYSVLTPPDKPKMMKAAAAPATAKAPQSITSIVDYLIYSNKTKKLAAHVISFFPNYITGVGVVSVQVKRTGEPIVSKEITIINQKSINETAVWDFPSMSAYKDETLVATFAVMPYTMDTYARTATTTFAYQIPVCELTDTIISKINIVDPIRKDNTLKDVNVTLYKRTFDTPIADSTVHYDYTDVDRYTSLKDSLNNLFLELSGSAEFSDTSMVFKGATVNEAWLCVYNDTTFVNYDASRLSFIKDSFSVATKGFKWDLKRGLTNREDVLKNINWYSDADTALYGAAGAHIYFHIHFIYGKSGDSASNKEGCMILSSTFESDETYKKKMPKLCFYRGCLAGDTEILMEDGSKKRIDTIRIGDDVAGYNGEKVRVTNITTGFEDKPLYVFRVEGSNRYLKASRDHVIKTERGLLPAYEIRGNDRIETQDHQFAAIEELFIEENQKVYNLELENAKDGGLLMIASGLVVGDSAMQHNHVYAPELPEIDQKILDELKRIEAYFNAGSESPSEQ